MSILCANQTVTLPFCTPECTRWTQINEGRPITYFHDTSDYDPNYYPALAGFDMDVMLSEAVAMWEASYTCGNLFRKVDNLAEADLLVRYRPGVLQDSSILGSALCFCDADNEICVRQVDHNEEFGFDKRKSEILLNCAEFQQNFLTQPQWLYVMVHELGHVLGMGHVFTQDIGIQSVMGGDYVFDADTGIFPHDINELQRRHPCGCIPTAPSLSDFHPGVLKLSTDYCPVCRGEPS